MRRGTLRVGTSGYQYRHWRSELYPDRLPQREWLPYYAGRFDTVEINNTFYGLPAPASVQRWRECTPPGFVFALKLSRLVTHQKRLREVAAALTSFFAIATVLGDKLGPVLVQLPPRFPVDRERLARFLALLPREHRYAIEFRDPSWLDEHVFAQLREHAAALVVHDALPEHPTVGTASFRYLRFHGERYAGDYALRTLREHAARIRGWLDAGEDVFAFFNNDLGGHAPRNAAELRWLVQART